MRFGMRVPHFPVVSTGDSTTDLGVPRKAGTNDAGS
jgi:hypothetical protein